jgi:hypothetical protein
MEDDRLLSVQGRAGEQAIIEAAKLGIRFAGRAGSFLPLRAGRVFFSGSAMLEPVTVEY